MYTHSYIRTVVCGVCVYVYVLSCVQLFVTPWMVAHQASLSMEFSRQEYMSWLFFPTPGDLSDPGMETVSLVSYDLTGIFFTIVPPGKPIYIYTYIKLILQKFSSAI